MAIKRKNTDIDLNKISFSRLFSGQDITSNNSSTKDGSSSPTQNNQKTEIVTPNPKPSDSGFLPNQNMEYINTLYETGLQNIFQDYEANLAKLNKQEQTNLQDAYYIRELSKKYLGEYASNLGIGDVSGNLLDIYGQYQSNVSNIKGQGDAQEMNLTQTYQNQRTQAMQEYAKAKFEAQGMQVDASSQDILTNVAMGETNGLSAFEYLDSRRGELTQEAYTQVRAAIYSSTLDEVNNNLSTGYYGFKTDENGQRVPITDPLEYIEQYRGVLSDRDFKALEGYIKYQQETAPATQKPVEGDPSYLYSGSENVTSDSFGVEIAGAQYYSVQPTKDKEGNLVDEGKLYDDTELNTLYAEESGVSVVPNGATYFDVQTQTYYGYKDGKWYRMVSSGGSKAILDNLTTEQMQKWSDSGNKKTNEANGFKRHKDGDEITFNNATYKADRKSEDTIEFSSENILKLAEAGKSASEIISSISSNLSPEQKKIVDKFFEVHGEKDAYGRLTGIKTPSVIYIDGKFWNFSTEGKIYPMNKK